MAKAPGIARILREALGTLNADIATPFDRLLSNLNPFMTAVTAALRNGLTPQDNFAGEVRTFTVTPPEDWIPVSFAPGSGFASPIGANQRLEVRKTWDATVKARGVFGRSLGAPPAGSLISSLTPEMLPKAREIFVTYTESPVQVGSLSVGPTGLKYENGAAGAIAVTGLEWMAANRTPPRWPTPIKLNLGTETKPFPGIPNRIEVLYAQPTNNPQETAIVTAVDWTPIYNLQTGKVTGVNIHRLWGLIPGTKYTVSIFISP